MVFSSPVFLWIFLPVIFIGYHIVPGRAKNILLLLGSLVFYAWGEPRYILLMLFSIGINYFLGLLMEKFSERKKLILVIDIIINLALLGYFKYFNFLAGIVNALFGELCRKRFGVENICRKFLAVGKYAFYMLVVVYFNRFDFSVRNVLQQLAVGEIEHRFFLRFSAGIYKDVHKTYCKNDYDYIDADIFKFVQSWTSFLFIPQQPLPNKARRDGGIFQQRQARSRPRIRRE